MATSEKYERRYEYEYKQYDGTNESEIQSWLSAAGVRGRVRALTFGDVYDSSGGNMSPLPIGVDQYLILNLQTKRIDVTDSVSHLVQVS